MARFSPATNILTKQFRFIMQIMMKNLHFQRLAAIGLLAFVFPFCKQNSVETAEARDAEGRLERYQRRKSDYAKEGLYQRFRADNTLMEEATYQNDTLEGERKYFYPNGKQESVERYHKGVIDGKFQKFYDNGALQVEQTYQNGVLEGLSIAFYPNGAVKEKVMLRNNEEDGAFSEYYETGKLKTEGFYEPGDDGPLETGTLKEYDETGQLIRVAECAKGICNTKWKK